MLAFLPSKVHVSLLCFHVDGHLSSGTHVYIHSNYLLTSIIPDHEILERRHQVLILNVKVLVWSLARAQFNLVAQSCLTLYDPMGCSMPGFPVHHQLPELTQTHVH